MRLPDYITTAQTNLLRTKTRTFLTVLAFVIGTFTLSMVTAFTQGIQAYIDTQLNALGQPNLITVTYANTSQQTSASGVPYYQGNRQATVQGRDKQAYVLNQNDLAAVTATSGVVAAYPNYSDLKLDYVQYGSSPRYLMQVQSAYPGETAQLTAGNLPGASQPTGIVLPFPYIQAFGGQSAGDLIGKVVQLQVTSLVTLKPRVYAATITGVLPDTVHQPAAYVSYQLVQTMVQYQAGTTAQFSSIAAFTQSGVTKAERLQVKNALQSKGYSAESYDDLLSSFNRPLSIVTAGLIGFAAVALLAATIGIVNTLLMSVLERTQEIGLLKALGMRRRGITFIYLIEAASIGLWGGVIGVVLAIIAGLVANPILNRTLFKGIGTAQILTYPLLYMCMIIVVAMLTGLLAGTIPAIRAGRLNAIDALRRE